MDVGLNNEVSLQNAYDEGLVSNIVFRDGTLGKWSDHKISELLSDVTDSWMHPVVSLLGDADQEEGPCLVKTGHLR